MKINATLAPEGSCMGRVQQMKNLATEGSRMGRVQQMKNLAPEGSCMDRDENKRNNGPGGGHLWVEGLNKKKPLVLISRRGAKYSVNSVL